MPIRLHWYEVKRFEQWFFEIPQILVILTVLGVSIYLKPDIRLYGTHEQLGLPACPSRALFGVPCPSCGMTTCFALMSRGDILQAFKANYFGPVIYILMMAYGAVLSSFVIRGKRVRYEGPALLPLSIAGGLFVIYGLCWVIQLIQ